jgi:hypothetical protein
LGALLASGVLTQEEFQAQKMILLGQGAEASAPPAQSAEPVRQQTAPSVEIDLSNEEHLEVLLEVTRGLVLGFLAGVFRREEEEAEMLGGEDMEVIFNEWLAELSNVDDPVLSKLEKFYSTEDGRAQLEKIVLAADEVSVDYSDFDEFMSSPLGEKRRQGFQTLLDNLSPARKDEFMYATSQLEIRTKKHVCAD